MAFKMSSHLAGKYTDMPVGDAASPEQTKQRFEHELDAILYIHA